MKPSPLAQILFVAALLLGAALSLRAVLGGGPALGSVRAETAAADPELRTAYLEFETTAPVRWGEVRWGERVIPPSNQSRSRWSGTAAGDPAEPLRIAGKTEPAELPFALRVEFEPDGAPTREAVLWVREASFSLALPLSEP